MFILSIHVFVYMYTVNVKKHFLLFLTPVGKVGIVLNIHWAQPKKPDDASHVQASERMMQFDFGWFANPLFVNGSYPGVMVDHVEKRSIAQGYQESRLPKFTSLERQEINGN